MLTVICEELGFGAIADRDRPMSRHIPYLRHVADTVVRLEGDALMSIIKLDGLFFQTEDQAELNMRSIVQNTILRALGSSRYSVWSTVVRRKVDATIDGTFEDPFCDELDRRYRASLAGKRMFLNEIYFAVLRSNGRGALAIGDRLRAFVGRAARRGAHDDHLRESVDELEEQIGNIVRDLNKYGARAMGIRHDEGRPYSEPCEFLNLVLACGIPRRMRLPRMGLANYVGTSRLHFSRRTMQAQGAVREDDRFG